MTAPFRNELREQVQLAAPICLAYLINHMMGVVDTAMLGRYDETAVAGAGIGNGLIFAVSMLGIGSVMGLDTLIPQAHGAGEARRARRLLWAGIRLAALVGTPLTLLVGLSPLVMPLFGVDEGVAIDAAAYTYGRLPTIIPMLAFSAVRSYLQAIKLTRPLVLAGIAGNLVNAGLDYALIFGVPSLGIPALGALGAALATTGVFAASLVVCALAVRAVEVPPGDDGGDETDRELMRKTLRLGVPVGLQLGAEVGVFALAGLLAGRIGATAGAAHIVALMIASLTFSVAVGLGSAAAVRVGHAIGRRDAPGTRRAGAAAFVSVLIYMSGTAAMLLSIPELLARLFTSEPAVAAAAVPLLRIAALFQLSDGVQAVGAGALRGAGDTRAAFVANLIGHYAVGLPVAILLAFPADLGATGLWIGLSAGLTATAIALSARFFWLTRRPIERA